MSWFAEKISAHSERNGEIRYMRQLGEWHVEAQGMDQSSDYLVGMWKHAVRRVPRDGVRSILVLGLGVGSCIPALRRRFPGASLKAIEWDPVMVGLADELHRFRPKDRPIVLAGDVREVLPRLQGSFDLIVCDLFDGPHVSHALREAPVIEQLRDRLSNGGWVLFNVFREPELFEGFDHVLSRVKAWKFRWNRLALYRRFGHGTAGDPLPAGFKPAWSYEGYVSRESRRGGSYREVGQPASPGMRWHHGPLWFEGYMGDIEPRIEMGVHRRLVTWQPVTRIVPPTGWRRSWLPANPILTGFAHITDPRAYWVNWSSQAKRHRTRWLKTHPYEIRSVPLEEFVASYGNRRMASWLVRLTIQLMRNKVKSHGERVFFFGAFDPVTKAMHAGLAVVDVPEGRQSIHVASFIRPEAKRTAVGVGLIDAWFQRCIGRGYCFLDFDLFWAPGDPRSWKGFSRFKSQFGITFIRYPHAFLRLAS